MATQTFTAANRNFEVLLTPPLPDESIAQVTIASGAGALSAGSVLGQSSLRQAAAPIPAIVGTGTGVMSRLAFGPGVKVGSYVITLLATSATAAFSVVAPGGEALPNGAVGTFYSSDQISFLIANGGTMTVGDTYTVAVTASGTPAIVGTGTGAMSAVSLGKSAQPGTYNVRVMTTSATSALQITTPSGATLAAGVIGTAYVSDHVNFSVANGGTMTAGDYYNIVVASDPAASAGLWDPTAVDGKQKVLGVLLGAVDATSAAQLGAAIVRNGVVRQDLLAWKSTVTAGQKADAIRQLAAANIISRPNASAAPGVMA